MYIAFSMLESATAYVGMLNTLFFADLAAQYISIPTKIQFPS